MKCSSIFILFFNLFAFVKYASAVLCYDCNSAFDSRCGLEFDSFSLGIVNCSLRDPLEHMPDVESTFCRRIKMEIFGKVRIVRQCGYLIDNTTENSCRRQSGTGDLFVTYCDCDTDLCNASCKPASSLVALSAAFIAVFVFRV